MRSDQRSEAAKAWRHLYSTTRWRAAREIQLSKQPLCERCLTRNVITPATVCHHKQAHKGDLALFWDLENLASSCAPCHDIDEQRLERGGRARLAVGEDGWPL